MFQDRLAELCKKHGVPVGAYGCNHITLDVIDRRAGIRTRHGNASAYFAGATPFPQSEYVGARLARLERHVDSNKEPAMFWLGAEGEGNGA